MVERVGGNPLHLYFDVATLCTMVGIFPPVPRLTLRLLYLWAIATTAAAAAEVTVKLEVAPGLKYAPARFVVAPGDQVTVILHNGDEMIHNFVLVQPEQRLKVVQAALTLGEEGPARNFVPPLPEVLASTRALNPNETGTLRFTAPSQVGVYPYVCTFPGHGFVMFGAMYVTKDGAASLPPLAKDRYVPPEIAAAAGQNSSAAGKWLLKVTDHPVVCRTFLPDTGPASIAVGLPGGQNYVFDTVTCSIRYVWKGGFVDNTDQWEGKGDLWSKVAGRIYFRAARRSPLRIGDGEEPAPRWLGYRMVEGYPQFHYTVGAAEVWQSVRAAPAGLAVSFEITGAPGPIRYVPEAKSGAAFTSDTGEWDAGMLTLPAAPQQKFTVTLTERPKVEPLGYWSMNDALWSTKRVDPAKGVVGRALTPGGLGATRTVLDTGISPSQLAEGATFMGWVLEKPASKTAAVFALGSGWLIPAPAADGKWHHIAVTFAGAKTTGELWVDGADQGATALTLAGAGGVGAPGAGETFTIGSAGDRFLAGLIDEVRIFDRPLTADEIKTYYEREARSGGLKQ
jgi:plastocyanin